MKSLFHKLSGAWHWVLQPLLVFGVLIVGFVGARFLTSKETTPPKFEKRTYAPLVRVEGVDTTSTPVRIHATGALGARTQVDLRAQVAGRVIEIHPQFRAGGVFEAGDVLLRIEPLDYELALSRAQAEVSTAETSLQTLEAEAQSARFEWRQLHGDEPIPPLVGKEPQLREAQVRVQAARAAVQGAQLNLDRTALKLPWPGRVVSTNVDVGGVVTVGQALATTYSTDIFEVTVPMRQDQLRWIHFDEDRATGEEVQGSGSPLTVLVRWPGADAERIEQQIVMPLEGSLRAVEGLRGLESKASHGLGWVRLDPTGEFDNGYMLERAHEAVQALAPFPPRPAADPEIFLGRPASMASVQVHVSGEAVELVGRAVRLESELDPVSRFARLVLEIDTHSLPSGLSRRLLPGLFADVVVRGEEVHGVAAIPRSALHDQNQVWVAVEDRLHFVTVEPVHTEEDQVWVRGLETGQELVLTDLEVVTDGMVIRKQVVEEQRADSVSGNAAQGMGATQ